MDQNFLLLLFFIFVGAIGSLSIIKKKPLHYGLIFILNIIFSVSLCLIFYWSGFYRFVLPLPYILVAVVLDFGLLVLFTIKYRPNKNTFSFYFMTLSWIFAIEIILEHIGFIQFRNGWDFWDSFSLYWIYVRLFNYLSFYFLPKKYKHPLSTESKIYWIFFWITVVLAIFVIQSLLIARA